MDRRAAVDRIIAYFFPVRADGRRWIQWGEALFAELINGRWQPGAGTTCAYLTAIVLYLLGARDFDLVNFDDPEGATKFEFGNTRNGISKLVNGAKKLGAWVDDGPGREPARNDLVYMSAGTSASEHVEVFRGIDGSTWEAAAAGQGTRELQRAEIITRTITDERAAGGHRYVSSLAGERKRIIGWVNIDAVPLVAPPSGAAAEPDSDESSSSGASAVAVVAVVGVIAAVGAGILLALRRPPPPPPPPPWGPSPPA